MALTTHPAKKIRNAAGISKPIIVVLLVFWFSVLALALANLQALQDAWRLHSYDPPSAIAAIAKETTMTDSARKTFYVNHPEITDKTTFSDKCPNSQREQTIVLGCYHGNQNGIFVLAVDDQRLNGVEQVTAAHEMLHAAYDRLTNKERERIDTLLINYYENGLTDSRIKKVIDGYRQTEPNDLVNEMHSIFGTEIAALPDNLEKYYKQYFTNRQAVATLAGNYQQEFTTRQTIVDNDDKELKQLKDEINQSESNLKQAESIIQSDRQRLESLRETNTQAYNSGVPNYNQRIEQYNIQTRQLQQLVNRYNQLVAERNQVAGEIDQLVDDLNANVQTIEN